MTNNNIINLSVEVGGKTITFETGLMARQADGAVVARLGDTMVLAAAVSDKNQKPGLQDFVPLTVNYKERTYSAGKIPGGFFKREARPSKKETLSSRIIDRSMRPLFPEGYACETNITAMVLSFDSVNDADVLSIAASSAAAVISSIPFTQPVAGVRINRVEGQYIINATLEERKKADMDLVIAGTEGGIMMVEGGANEVDEEALIQAIALAHPEIKKLCRAQLELREKSGNRAKFEFNAEKLPQDVLDAANAKYRPEVNKILHAFLDKQTRDVSIAKLKDEFKAELSAKYPEMGGDYGDSAMEMLAYEESRNMVVNEGVRVDGRKTEEIRPLSSIVGLLPNAHGSALFTRGQTQGLVVSTLGTGTDAQLVEGLAETYDEVFMLHYNFPGFSTGECKPDRSPGRREIGHGELARRALLPLLPSHEDFPYTIRVVSDIMESNGSSSMASVC
ncbi:MAG: polyribonucleotide nucleotidyltransferase, partial [Elusimicrobiota bacterium]|nr:polyribonucleotide nucleotidyltransferase [Elusimicrobiota bacterium]